MKSLRSFVLVVLCFSLLGGGGLWILLGSHPAVSERENRALSPLPTLSLRSALDGRFQQGLGRAARDRIPFRASLLSLCGLWELGLGRAQYNGILLGKDGFLIPHPDGDRAVVTDNLADYRALSSACEERGLSCHLTLAPRGVDLLADKLPAGYDPRADEWLWETVSEEAESAILYRTLRESEDPAALHYRTDHHLNTHGAYAIYEHLGGLLDYAPLPASCFDPVTVTDRFLGTSDSKVCLPGVSPDEVVLYRYVGDTLADVTDRETGETRHGFYAMETLEKKDCYGVFLGGNFAHLSVSLPTGEEKPTLLLIKDSYANPVIPFLALHFELEVIDPRYDVVPLSKRLEEISCDAVLFLCGADTFSEQKGLFS